MQITLPAALLWFALVAPATAAEFSPALGIRVPGSIEELFAVVHEDTAAGLKFIGAYSSFLFQGVREYQSPELGYSLGYVAPNGSQLSIYVYDMGIADIPDGVDSPLLQKELADAEQGIAVSGNYSRVQRVVAPERLSPHFVQYTHLLTTPDGEAVRSHTLVRGQNGRFVKLRVTGTEARLDDKVRQALDYLVADLGITGA